MAEHDRDEDLSRRYRELAREEPPRALDDAILAAARRELETRPAPLVAPTGRRRWAVPVAAAAVIVLSAVVTLHVQREQPDLELAEVPQSQAPAAARKDEAPASAPRAEMQEQKIAPQANEVQTQTAKPAAPKAQAERRRAQEAPAQKAVTPAPAGESSALARAPAEPTPLAEQGRFSPDPGPAAAAAPPPPPSPSATPPQMQMRPAAPAAQPAPRAADSATAAGASPPAVAQDRDAAGSLRDHRMLAKREAAAESPEKMLERIAALRREGRGREADDLYAEFKRRFPDYRIPDALREQVVPR